MKSNDELLDLMAKVNKLLLLISSKIQKEGIESDTKFIAYEIILMEGFSLILKNVGKCIDFEIKNIEKII